MVLSEDGDVHPAQRHYDVMPGRHLLTFELAEDGDELAIYGDPPGLRLLSGRLAELADKVDNISKPGVEQLSTSVWGGNELSLEPQGSDTRLIYQVRIVGRPKK